MSKHKHNHIVPRSYLAGFASNGALATTFVADGRNEVISTRDAAVRSNFYVFRDGEGNRVTAVERAFGDTENRAVEVVRRIDSRWPLSDGDHGALAEFLALQFVRSPAWRVYHHETREESLASVDRSRWPDADWNAHVAYVGSDAFRANHMLRQIALVGTIFGSMHWQLVAFGSDRLVTGDHPVVCVPSDPHEAAVAVPRFGLKNIAEVRFPLTPSRALVLTWLDEPNDLAPARGFPVTARQLNHAVVRQAEQHWFARPGGAFSVVDQGVSLVSPSVHRSFDIPSIEGSDRRRRALEAAQRMIDDQDHPREMTIVRVRRAA